MAKIHLAFERGFWKMANFADFHQFSAIFEKIRVLRHFLTRHFNLESFWSKIMILA